MAYEFEEPFAALISSSARHSATDLTLRKALSRVYIVHHKMHSETSAKPNTYDERKGINTYANGNEGNRLIDSSEGRNIDGLTTYGTLRANTSAVFTWASIDNSINENLDRVLVGEEVNDFECVCDDSNSQELLAVIAALHHQARINAINRKNQNSGSYDGGAREARQYEIMTLTCQQDAQR
jgi:hypothetical protein